MQDSRANQSRRTTARVQVSAGLWHGPVKSAPSGARGPGCTWRGWRRSSSGRQSRNLWIAHPTSTWYGHRAPIRCRTFHCYRQMFVKKDPGERVAVKGQPPACATARSRAAGSQLGLVGLDVLGAGGGDDVARQGGVGRRRKGGRAESVDGASVSTLRAARVTIEPSAAVSSICCQRFGSKWKVRELISCVEWRGLRSPRPASPRPSGAPPAARRRQAARGVRSS